MKPGRLPAPAAALRRPVAAWASLALLLLITAAAWRETDHYVYDRIDERFQRETRQIATAVEQRMQEYELVLRGAAGLFYASGEVQRDEWRKYVNGLAMERYFPGIQGVGYAPQIPAEQLSAHIAAIRAEGFPDYAVRPAGDRPVYTPIIYLEPFVDRNLRAFGYDMYAEPIRRAAMDYARDNGSTALSGVITLMQEDGRDPQRGVLLYLALYRKGAPIDGVEQRRAALEGFVYSPFRIGDLMLGVLGREHKEIHLQLYDESAADSAMLLEHHHGLKGENSDTSGLAAHKAALPLRMTDRTWVLYAHADSRYATATETTLPLLIAGGGGVIDALLFLTFYTQITQRRKAEDLAQAMTAELQRKNRDLEQFANVLSHHMQEPVRLIHVFSQRLEKLLGDGQSDDIRQSLETVRTAAARERALLRDVQLYLAVGQERIPAANSSALRAAEAAKRHLAPLAARTQAEIIIDPLPDVAVAANQLIEVFIALLSNALNHRVPGRRPVVRVAASPIDDGLITFSVTDNGPGVPPEHRERVFNVFERLSPSADRDDDAGTGIGLPLARRVVEAAAGRIWIETAPQGGAAVRFTLPAASHRPETAVMPAAL